VVVMMMMKVKGACTQCHIVEKFIHGKRRRRRVINVVSLGMEFVRSLVLEVRWEGMPCRGGTYSKRSKCTWMGKTDKQTEPVQENGIQSERVYEDVSHEATIPRSLRNPSIHPPEMIGNVKLSSNDPRSGRIMND